MADPLPREAHSTDAVPEFPTMRKKLGDPFNTETLFDSPGDPSLFEHEAFELPSSTAPARLEDTSSMPSPPKCQRTLPSRAESSIAPTSTPTPIPTYNRVTRSTTKLALAHGAGGPEDPYEPDTERERAYMRSINPDKLASIDIFEDKDSSEEKDEYEIDVEIEKYT
jgi:hypothetical protein